MRVVFGFLPALAIGCGAGLPRPPGGPVPSSALIPVPYPPPPARSEEVPPRPERRAVWIDGQWEWSLRRWQWAEGGWVLAPSGVYFTPWLTVRRADGQLFFAPPAWRAQGGKPVRPPPVLAPAGVLGHAGVRASR